MSQQYDLWNTYCNLPDRRRHLILARLPLWKTLEITLTSLPFSHMLENMKDEDYNDDFPSTPVELVSKCCGASSLTELYDTKLGNIVGVCSTCKERTTFDPEIEDER